MTDSYKVGYSVDALDDLREIYSYIANELLAPETATAQLGHIRKDHPARGADHLRMAPRAGHGPPRTRRARLGALRRDADPDRGFQRQRTHPGLLRHAAQRSAPECVEPP